MMKRSFVKSIDSCLVGSILVQTIMGPIPISVLAKRFDAGEHLPDALSWDPVTNLTCWKPIMRAWKAHDDRKFPSRIHKTVIARTIYGLCFESTPKYLYHRFGEQKASITAEDLRIKQRLTTVGPAYSGLVFDEMDSMKILEHHQPVIVYGIEVADTHLLAITNPWAFHSIIAYDSEFMKKMKI